MSVHDRIVIATTVHGTVARAARFLRRALSSGVDHIVVFLADDRPDLRPVLDGHGSVSVVRTDASYWNGDVPRSVQERHRANANVAIRALANVESAGWVFQVAEDEVLSFDRDELLALNPRAVRFKTLEAAASRRWRTEEPKQFKKRPTEKELYALAGLGIIDRPEVGAFFRGPYGGRIGVRPAADVRFRGRNVYEAPNELIATVMPPAMYVLNHESWCLEDFLDRWQSSDPENPKRGTYRGEHVGSAVHTLQHHPALRASTRQRLLETLFDRLVADDIDALADFGLLVERPPRTRAEPRPLPAEDVDRLESALVELHTVDKSTFRSGLPGDGVRAGDAG